MIGGGREEELSYLEEEEEEEKEEEEWRYEGKMYRKGKVEEIKRKGGMEGRSGGKG